MNNMNNQLIELINANMPGIQAQAMQEYIEQAEKDKKNLKSAQSSIDTLRADHNKQDEEITSLKARVRDLVPFKTKHEEVLEKERDLRVQMAEMRVEEAEKRATSIESLAQTMFRNASVRKTVSSFGSTPVAVAGYVINESYNNTTTETLDED